MTSQERTLVCLIVVMGSWAIGYLAQEAIGAVHGPIPPSFSAPYQRSRAIRSAEPRVLLIPFRIREGTQPAPSGLKLANL